MTPSQARAELLGEHFELRRLIEGARAILDRNIRAAPEELEGPMDALASALLAHAAHEEAALRATLKPAGQRAQGRDAFMDERHVAEHAKLVEVLRATHTAKDPSAIRQRVIAVLGELEAHMTVEEEVLLAEDLLADDVASA